MNKEKLKEATELIQKLVPSIMELSVGCRVTKDNLTGTVFFIDGKYLRMYIGRGIYDVVQPVTILGRPIQLSDVLRSIDSKGFGRGVMITADGGIDIYFNDIWINVTTYDLTKPFKDQSEQFLDFIVKTLKPC